MKTVFLAVLSAVLLLSCKKSVKELPPATQTGANTFGAMIDGTMWVPQTFGVIPASNTLEAKYLGTNFFLKAQNFSSSPIETEFDIVVINMSTTGSYPLNTNVTHPSYSASYGYYVKRNLSPIYEWQTSTTQTGSVTISRLDTAAHIISGTFQFKAAEIYDPANVITVSEGRFDVKY